MGLKMICGIIRIKIFCIIRFYLILEVGIERGLINIKDILKSSVEI